MTYLKHILTIVLAFWVAGAQADQNDPRLDSLFSRLQQGEANQARPIEQQIWSIWLESSDPDTRDILESGMNRMRVGDLEMALRSFSEVVRINPDFAEGWNKRATVHYLLGNFERSLADIDKTLALEPRHFGALAGQGMVYTQLNNLEQALSAYERAVKVHPHLPGPLANIEAIRKILEQQEI